MSNKISSSGNSTINMNTQKGQPKKLPNRKSVRVAANANQTNMTNEAYGVGPNRAGAYGLLQEDGGSHLSGRVAN